MDASKDSNTTMDELAARFPHLRGRSRREVTDFCLRMLERHIWDTRIPGRT